MEIPTTAAVPTLGEMLAKKKTLHDRKDELNAELTAVNKDLDSVDHRIIDALKASEQSKATANGITVSLGTTWRASYAPEMWEGIVKWAVQNDMTYLVQRRLSDSKVMELVDRGIQLPDGLKVEGYANLSHRRV